MGSHSLTTGIKSTFDDPMLGGGDPNDGADPLGGDYAHRNMHLVIRDVSVFSINNHELRSHRSGTSGTGTMDTARLTSNPVRATILARDAPGNMSQEPAIQIKGVKS